MLVQHRRELAINAIMYPATGFLHVALVVMMMMVLGGMVERRLTLTKEASRGLVRLGSTFTIANRIDRSLIFGVYSVCRLVG